VTDEPRYWLGSSGCWGEGGGRGAMDAQARGQRKKSSKEELKKLKQEGQRNVVRE
jgi:hypothetical protein